MKYYHAAAGALLLGTSALAWAGDAKTVAVEPTDTSISAKSDLGLEKSAFDKTALAAKSDLAMGDAKLELATLDKTLEGSDAKFQTAAFDSKAMGWSDGDAKLQTASMDSKVDSWSGDKVETAWVDDTKVDTVAFDKAETGMGGPLEETTSVSPAVVEPSNADPEHDARGIAVISDAAFVPPGYNGSTGAVGGPVEGGDDESYPACTAEVTDNCIQLYERGVRGSLADAKSGSLDGTTETSAVGGPFEPVDGGSDALAMNGDGQVDSDMGEIADLGAQSATATETALTTDTAVVDHSAYQGVGGPVEAQSGYPPCSPGPGDDRCIQLYERGVTGAGN